MDSNPNPNPNLKPNIDIFGSQVNAGQDTQPKPPFAFKKQIKPENQTNPEQVPYIPQTPPSGDQSLISTGAIGKQQNPSQVPPIVESSPEENKSSSTIGTVDDQLNLSQVLKKEQPPPKDTNTGSNLLTPEKQSNPQSQCQIEPDSHHQETPALQGSIQKIDWNQEEEDKQNSIDTSSDANLIQLDPPLFKKHAESYNPGDKSKKSSGETLKIVFGFSSPLCGDLRGVNEEGPLGQISFKDEYNGIQGVLEKLKTSDIAVTLSQFHATKANFAKYVTKQPPTILHLSMHGERVQAHPLAKSKTFLIFDDGFGNPKRIRDLEKLPTSVKLVVLTACTSEELGRSFLENNKELRYVICITNGSDVDNKACESFSQNFYEKLVQLTDSIECPIQQAFDYAKHQLTHEDEQVKKCAHMFTLLDKRSELYVHETKKTGNSQNELGIFKKGGLYNPDYLCKKVVIPKRNPNFSGREDQMKEILSSVLADCRVTIVQGTLGAGKTETVTWLAHYIHERSHFMGGIFFFSFDAEEHKGRASQEEIYSDLLAKLATLLKNETSYSHFQSLTTKDQRLDFFIKQMIQQKTLKFLLILDSINIPLDDDEGGFRELVETLVSQVSNLQILATCTGHLKDFCDQQKVKTFELRDLNDKEKFLLIKSEMRRITDQSKAQRFFDKYQNYNTFKDFPGHPLSLLEDVKVLIKIDTMREIDDLHKWVTVTNYNLRHQNSSSRGDLSDSPQLKRHKSSFDKAIGNNKDALSVYTLIGLLPEGVTIKNIEDLHCSDDNPPINLHEILTLLQVKDQVYCKQHDSKNGKFWLPNYAQNLVEQDCNQYANILHKITLYLIARLVEQLDHEIGMSVKEGSVKDLIYRSGEGERNRNLWWNYYRIRKIFSAESLDNLGSQVELVRTWKPFTVQKFLILMASIIIAADKRDTPWPSETVERKKPKSKASEHEVKAREVKLLLKLYHEGEQKSKTQEAVCQANLLKLTGVFYFVQKYFLRAYEVFLMARRKFERLECKLGELLCTWGMLLSHQNPETTETIYSHVQDSKSPEELRSQVSKLREDLQVSNQLPKGRLGGDQIDVRSLLLFIDPKKEERDPSDCIKKTGLRKLDLTLPFNVDLTYRWEYRDTNKKWQRFDEQIGYNIEQFYNELSKKRNPRTCKDFLEFEEPGLGICHFKHSFQSDIVDCSQQRSTLSIKVLSSCEKIAVARTSVNKVQSQLEIGPAKEELSYNWKLKISLDSWEQVRPDLQAGFEKFYRDLEKRAEEPINYIAFNFEEPLNTSAELTHHFKVKPQSRAVLSQEKDSTFCLKRLSDSSVTTVARFNEIRRSIGDVSGFLDEDQTGRTTQKVISADIVE